MMNITTERTDTPQVSASPISRARSVNWATWMPPVFLILAAVLLLGSIPLPYWQMHLDAPQYNYRGGLDVVIYINSMTGKDPEFDELRELNGLNHYIGMRKLDEAAVFERSIAIPSLIVFTVLLATVAFAAVRKVRWQKWSLILTLPPLLFPLVFIADLYYWLRDSGQNLDPTAALSSTIKPFTPTMLGKGEVGQFATDASLQTGWYLALVASILILVAVVWIVVDLRKQRAAAQKVES